MASRHFQFRAALVALAVLLAAARSGAQTSREGEILPALESIALER